MADILAKKGQISRRPQSGYDSSFQADEARRNRAVAVAVAVHGDRLSDHEQQLAAQAQQLIQVSTAKK